MQAIISDIHSNAAAFEAVLDDIDDQAIEQIVCLGDVVGYGPDPVECVDRLAGLRAAGRVPFVIRGNHEEGLLHEPLGFNRVAAAAILWTRGRLRRADQRFLAETVLAAFDGRSLYVHGSPREPTLEYLLPWDTHGLFGEMPLKIRDNLALVDSICFVGHTHMPGVIDRGGRFRTPAELGGAFRVADGPAIVNVGSVGQPRDGDPRASYATFDGERVVYRRVAYDVARTAGRIRAVADLDDRLADRVEAGR